MLLDHSERCDCCVEGLYAVAQEPSSEDSIFSLSLVHYGYVVTDYFSFPADDLSCSDVGGKHRAWTRRWRTA